MGSRRTATRSRQERRRGMKVNSVTRRQLCDTSTAWPARPLRSDHCDPAVKSRHPFVHRRFPQSLPESPTCIALCSTLFHRTTDARAGLNSRDALCSVLCMLLSCRLFSPLLGFPSSPLPLSVPLLDCHPGQGRAGDGNSSSPRACHTAPTTTALTERQRARERERERGDQANSEAQ